MANDSDPIDLSGIFGKQADYPDIVTDDWMDLQGILNDFVGPGKGKGNVDIENLTDTNIGNILDGVFKDFEDLLEEPNQFSQVRAPEYFLLFSRGCPKLTLLMHKI